MDNLPIFIGYKLMLKKIIRLLTMQPQRSSSIKRQEKWTRSWASENFTPKWQAVGIPRVLCESVARNWLSPDSTVLDIGCGQGEIAAWLAEAGFYTTGLDFAPTAIARCKATYQQKRVRFVVGDVCKNLDWLQPFDCLFDRGCLHGLSEPCAKQYILNISNCLKVGGKFLLLYRAIPGRDTACSVTEKQQQVQKKVTTLFQSTFIIEDVRFIDMITGAKPSSTTTHPGLAFWMVRN